MTDYLSASPRGKFNATSLTNRVTDCPPGWDLCMRIGAHYLVWYAFFIMALFACGLSFLHISRHLYREGPRDARTAAIRVIFMVPFYAVGSLVALFTKGFHGNSLTPSNHTPMIIFNFCLKCYECVAIIAFTQLLVANLGGVALLEMYLRPEHCRHIFPVTWIVREDSWAPPCRFIRRTLCLVYSYFPATIICLLILIITSVIDHNQSSHLIRYAQMLTNAVYGLAQLCAVYGLVLFAYANFDLLKELKPVSKLLSIKVMVLVTFWQEVTIAFLDRQFRIFRPFADGSASGYTERQIASGFMNCLVIMEMFLLSIAHFFIYPCGQNESFRTGLDRSFPFTETSSVLDDRESISLCCCSCRSVRLLFARLGRALNIMDIYTFRNDVHFHLRSESMDLLNRPGCACCTFLCCEFLPGRRVMDLPPAGGDIETLDTRTQRPLERPLT